MKFQRIATVLAALSLAACGSKDEPKKAGAAKEAPAQNESGSILTVPITAPMQARRRLLHDMKKHKDNARDRERQFEQAIGRDR